ncbi:MAG: bifunctional 5,10-methylenetetrahydrofolate dehydrogenase/5,10-methenyltetrahydrofolate cyclohydrolase [Chloroflexota bacterium]
MTATILDGRKLSAEIRADLVHRVEALSSRGVVPALSGILVGDDAGSASYIRLKEKAASEVGLRSEMVHLSQDVTQKDLFSRLAGLNERGDVHGIFVQLPLPARFDEEAVLEAINPAKDVDGFHPLSVGRSWLGQPSFVPATPAAVVEMLKRYGYDDLAGQHVVIVNVDNLVGKPLASLLCRETVGATVTLCHPDSADLATYTRQADVLIVSVNQPAFITADMVKEGVVALDFGSNYVDDPSVERGYRVAGDIDYEAVKEKAEAITPVPGGLGPMTVTMLLAHTVMAAEQMARCG